ncbi:hypothetical protein COCON_G00004150 [Conger conger]|uniref:Ig-like domain-containing protein n=1 Tax=Conger conger TaxID=82655 RepID=A0A9Q1E174_CONCO|nr:hypothetical protein COCON_G00004150 [Conger conger]
MKERNGRLRAASQRVKVQPEVVSYPGETITLRCTFPDQGEIQLTQVSWIWEPTNEGERDNIAVYHPQFGASYPASPFTGRVDFTTPSLDNPSITIKDVKMTDEGNYICEYATYPSGNEQGTTALVILAKPKNTASIVSVSWVTALTGNATTASGPGEDSTVTVSSEYRMVPRPRDNGKDLTCIVNQRAQEKAQSIPLKLVIEYPPQVNIIGYDNNWYVGRTNVVLTCEATANPVADSVVWKAGPMPDTVQVKNKVLTVLKVDDRVNTTFVCEVKNRLGVGKDQVTAVVREPSKDPSNVGVVAGAIIGSLLALLLVAALIAVLVTRSRRQQQGYRGNANQGAYDIKTRIFGGKKTSKNGAGGNNNGPIYTYRESDSETLTEKSNNAPRGEPLNTTPTAHDILLSNDLDESERRKFDELEAAEEEDEGYDHFAGAAPILQIRPHDPHDPAAYLDDDMESQRDGSVISRTAVYV